MESGRPVNLWLIRALHAELLKGERGAQHHPGESRKIQNFVGRSNTLEDATYVPPLAIQAQGCLEPLEQYGLAEDAEAPLVRLWR